MKFDVYGGFKIARQKNRHGLFDNHFWNQVKDVQEHLPDACGCYIFALRNGRNIVPWYVGKTEKRTFRQECFQATKINYYNEVLIDRKGQALLFLIPRLTIAGTRFATPTTRGYRDVEFLESALIGLALDRNKQLMNIKKTKFFREMIVPGVVNSPPGGPTASVQELRVALGLL